MNNFTRNIWLRKWDRLFFFCGILMAGSECWKQWYLTFELNHGSYNWWYLPFQLCSIGMYVLLILPWVKQRRIRLALLSFLMNYSLLGGIAVFADTSGLHYPVAALTIHSYLWHVLLILIGLFAGITYMIEQSFHLSFRKDFLHGTMLYLGCCAVAELLNHCLDRYGSINMFYINPDYEMQQVGFSKLVPYIGNDAAIFIYILSTILGALILFYIWKVIARIYQHFFSFREDN